MNDSHGSGFLDSVARMIDAAIALMDLPTGLGDHLPVRRPTLHVRCPRTGPGSLPAAGYGPGDGGRPRLGALDRGAETSQTGFDALVAAIDLVAVVNHRCPLGGDPAENESGPTAQIESPHLGTLQRSRTANHGAVPVPVS